MKSYIEEKPGEFEGLSKKSFSPINVVSKYENNNFNITGHGVLIIILLQHLFSEIGFLNNIIPFFLREHYMS